MDIQDFEEEKRAEILHLCSLEKYRKKLYLVVYHRICYFVKLVVYIMIFKE